MTGDTGGVGMEETALNRLETAIVDWLVSFYQDEALTGQLQSAHVSRREWTEVGWYVYVHVPDTTAPVDASRLGDGGWPIMGPQVRSPGLTQDAGVILWGKQGIIDCIEMFAYGSKFPSELNEFELVAPISSRPKP